MTEIRSYRRVFDLERRIYSVDRIRLNPGGVPVRGVMYLLASILIVTLAARLPGIGMFLRLLPWYLRELALPGLAASVLAAIRIEGRTFHLTAWSLVRSSCRPARTTALGRAARSRRRWRPSQILFLPDGSDPRLRALRYTGPGALRVSVPHLLATKSRTHFSRRPVMEIRPAAGAERCAPGRVIELRSDGCLVVARDGRS